MKKIWIFFVLALVLFFPTFLFAQTAKIIDVKGEVLVKKDAAGDWQKAKVNMLLGREAEIETKRDSFCTLAFDEEQKNILTLKENSRIKIENVKPGNIFLPEGRVFSLIQNLSRAETFQIRTPTAIAGARGTGWISGFSAGTASTMCFEDSVFVQGLDSAGNTTGEQELNSGFGLDVGAGGVFGSLMPMGDRDYQEWRDFKGYTGGLIRESGEEKGEGDSFGDLTQEEKDSLGDIGYEKGRAEKESGAETTPKY